MVETSISLLIIGSLLMGIAFVIRKLLAWERAERDRQARAIAVRPAAAAPTRSARTWTSLLLMSPVSIAVGISPFVVIALIAWTLAGWYGVVGTLALLVVTLVTLYSDTRDLYR